MSRNSLNWKGFFTQELSRNNTELYFPGIKGFSTEIGVPNFMKQPKFDEIRENYEKSQEDFIQAQGLKYLFFVDKISKGFLNKTFSNFDRLFPVDLTSLFVLPQVNSKHSHFFIVDRTNSNKIRFEHIDDESGNDVKCISSRMVSISELNLPLKKGYMPLLNVSLAPNYDCAFYRGLYDLLSMYERRTMGRVGNCYINHYSPNGELVQKLKPLSIEGLQLNELVGLHNMAKGI